MSLVTSNQPYRTPTWIDLGVPDLERAIEFYRALFGWKFEVGPEAWMRYTTCRLHGRRVAGIAPNPDPGASDSLWTWWCRRPRSRRWCCRLGCGRTTTTRATTTTRPPPRARPPRPERRPPPRSSLRPAGSIARGISCSGGIYGRAYFLRDLVTPQAANRLTHVNYAFKNIDPVNLTCLNGVTRATTANLENPQGDGA